MLQMPEDTKNVREETGNVEPSLVSLSRKCSNCGQTGHNSRTCLEVREPTASEAEHKSHTGDSNTTQAPLQHTELQQDGTARDEDAEASDCSGGGCRESKKKGVAWTEDEHKLFLQGLQKLGKGDWRGISRQFVQTRSPTQVASHAQKFFIRQSVVGKRKRRSSLFDLVPEGMQEVKDQSAVSMERSKLAPETAARPSSENLPQPGAVLPPLAQGAEAFAVACWYQSMMLQQCWMQSMFSQPHPPNWGAIPIPPGPQPTNREGSVPSSENSASFFQDQQILASLAAQQHAAAFSAQQQLSAFMGKQGGPPEQSWPLGNDIPEMVFKAMRSSLPNLPGKEAAKHRVDEREQQQRGENPPPEVFGNGRLVKPKAHRAQSVQSLGSVPSYMMTSQSEGNPQLTSSSKDSQDSLARLCGLSGAADPSSYTGGIGSTLAFNASSHLEKSTASEGSRTLKHLIPK